jgi:hypothetical protein
MFWDIPQRAEADHAGYQEGLAPEHVAELACDRHQRGRGDQVGGGDPGVVVEAAQVGDDPRHRDTDDRLVERGKEQGHGHADGGEHELGTRRGLIRHFRFQFSSSGLALFWDFRLEAIAEGFVPQ